MTRKFIQTVNSYEPCFKIYPGEAIQIYSGRSLKNEVIKNAIIIKKVFLPGCEQEAVFSNMKIVTSTQKKSCKCLCRIFFC